MASITVDGRVLELNEEGFLADPSAWNRHTAEELARVEEGIADLSERHWAVVDCIRSYYEANGLAPMIRLLCQHTGLRLRDIYTLFPSGPAKGACKIAGLPKPDGCV